MPSRFAIISTSTNMVCGISALNNPPAYYYGVASENAQVNDYYDGTHFWIWAREGTPYGTPESLNTVDVPPYWILREF